MRKKSKRLHRPERDLAIHQVLRAIRGRASSDIARETYVTAATINRWRSAKTKYPQHHTLAAVARVAGLEWKLVEIDDTRVSARKAEAADRAAAG